MSPAIVTAVLLTVTLLIIGGFLMSAWLAHRQHMRVVKEQQNDLETTTGRMMMVVQLLDGSMVGVENSLQFGATNKLPAVVPSAHLPQSWYNRRRTVVSMGLLSMMIIGLLIQTGVAGDAFQVLTQGLNLPGSRTSVVDLNTAFQPIPFSASARILRIDSAARNQYYNDDQYQSWSYSSCSGISLVEVMNSYGRKFIASDSLQVEWDMGIWNSVQGLTGGEPGMARAAAHFGFQTNPNPPRTLENLILTANKGFPVIVGSTGHILVVKGGDANFVYLVDSAPPNRQRMTHDQFMSFWNGFSVLITPESK